MAPKKKAGDKKSKKTAEEKAADPEELRAAFAAFDLDGDGAISKEELKQVLSRPTVKVGGTPYSEAEAEAEASRIVNGFDKNGDGKLQYDEFISWLLGGSKPSSAVVPGASKAAKEEHSRLVEEEYNAVFAKYDKGSKGGLKKVELAQIIKDENENYGFLDDSTMPGFIKQAWTDAQPDAENLCRIEPFREWYASFLAHLADVKERDKMAASQAAAEKEAAAATAFSGDGLWTCHLKMLQDGLQAAWAKGKTPLLIDATQDQGGVSALETFYSYSGHQLLELKKMVVEVNMKKEKTLEEALDEARRKLVLSMKQGYNFVFLLANSAPPLKSKFSSPTALPYLLLEDNAAVASSCGQDYSKVDWTKELLTDADQILFVHKDFQTLAVTKFSEEDYVEFLKEEMPLDAMQHIKVTTS